MLSFLKKIHEALKTNPNCQVLTLYTDFSDAFDKVPHYELIQKVVAEIAIGWCPFEILINCLEDRKQFVGINNFS